MHLRLSELSYEPGQVSRHLLEVVENAENECFHEREMAYNTTGSYNERRRYAPPPSTVANSELDKALVLVKPARGHAELLYEALVNVEGPQDLWGGVIPVCSHP